MSALTLAMKRWTLYPLVHARGSLGVCPSPLPVLSESGQGLQLGPLDCFGMLQEYGLPGLLLWTIGVFVNTVRVVFASSLMA